MQWDVAPYALTLFISAAIAATLAIFVWERRTIPGSRPFAAMMLAVGAWALFGGIEFLSSDPAARYFWNNLKTLGIVSSPVLWLIFAAAYSGRRAWLTRRRVILLSLVPALTLILRWFLPLDLADPMLVMGPAGQTGFARFFQQWFLGSTIYSLGLLLVGSAFLLLSLKHTSGWYFRHIASLLGCILLPWVGYGLDMLRGLSGLRFDITPVFFALSGLVITWGVYRFGLLDMAPVARAAVVEALLDGVLIFDERERVVDANPTAGEILGMLPGTMIGQPVRHVLSRFPQLVAYYETRVAAGFDVQLVQGEETRSYQIRLTPFRDPNQRVTRHLVVLRDMTAYKRSEQELEKSHALLLSTLDATADGIMVSNGRGKQLRFNRKFVEMWRLPDLALTATEQETIQFVLDQLVNPAAFYRLMNKLATQPDADSYDVLELKDGRVYERYSRPQRIGDTRVGRVWSFRDITEQKRAEEKLRYLSTHDILTGLYNRVYFEEEINRLENSRQFPISMIMADVDNLKNANDRRGHQEGDDLLRRAAEIMRHGCRAEDMVARIGGDEFGIILPFSDEQVAENAVERMRNMLAISRVGENHERLSLSIGYATGHNGESLRKVLRQADKNMYLSKEAKRRRPPPRPERVDEPRPG